MMALTTCTPHAHKEKGSVRSAALWVDHSAKNSAQSVSCFWLCASIFDSHASKTQAEKLELESCAFASSTHWSIFLAKSCGNRIPLYMVLLFIWPLAMSAPHKCLNTKKNTAKFTQEKVFKQNALTCLNTIANLFKHIVIVSRCQNSNASECGNTTEASNHNVKEAYTMAYQHSTQTRPEFTYLFLGTPSDKPNTTPVVLRAEANTEQQARSHFLNWNLVFAAQIRTKSPCRLQLIDGGEHFSWVFEQRFDACTSGVQEVAHV